MASPAKQLIEAGFVLEVIDGGRLGVTPAAKLTPELRTFIRDHKPEILASLTAEAANDGPPPLPGAAEWETLDKAYQAHHLACPACVAAGKGYGLRCGTGSALWAEYDQATEPPRKRKDVRQ